MATKATRGLVVGASTLLGKELAEGLSTAQPPWDLSLTDVTDSGGKIVAAGDEALLVQPLRPDVFEGVDVAFFADSQASTRSHWREARDAGATVVDLTGALEGEPHVLVRSPWIEGGHAPELSTAAVVTAHPAAVMLGLAATRLAGRFGRIRMAATVLEPASQQGSRGMDEMHQQTVNLLGFHSLPQEVYDAQVAFNLRVSVGEEARLDLSEISDRIRRDLRTIAGEKIVTLTAMQLVQAPVFHGYTISLFAELPAEADAQAVREALKGGVVEVTESGAEPPSNQSVTGTEGVQIAVTEDPAHPEGARGFWLWMAADNLKLAAHQAVMCATELAALRPVKPIQ
jgi:aspartate-semialdehyde dehydrogenase